jgi:hypothetical protein
VPRAGETVALEAYERMVQKALSDGTSQVELEDRLKAAGIAAEQAAAASAAYQLRLPEMRAQMAEASAQVRHDSPSLRARSLTGVRACCRVLMVAGHGDDVRHTHRFRVHSWQTWTGRSTFHWPVARRARCASPQSNSRCIWMRKEQGGRRLSWS